MQELRFSIYKGFLAWLPGGNYCYTKLVGGYLQFGGKIQFNTSNVISYPKTKQPQQESTTVVLFMEKLKTIKAKGEESCNMHILNKQG